MTIAAGSAALASDILVEHNANGTHKTSSAYTADHTALSNKGTNTHAQIDTFISNTVWQTYTPTWAGGSPSIGNGTLTGRYALLGSNILLVQIYLVGGSTTNWGSGGNYSFSLPGGYTSASGTANVGAATLSDTGATRYACIAVVEPSATTMLLVYGNATVTSTAPFTLGDTDVIAAQIEVRI